MAKPCKKPPGPLGPSTSSVHPRPFTEKSHRPSKRQKTGSTFIDISTPAGDGDNDDECDDEEDQEGSRSGSPDALKALPGSAGCSSHAQQPEKPSQRHQDQPRHSEGSPQASPLPVANQLSRSCVPRSSSESLRSRAVTPLHSSSSLVTNEGADEAGLAAEGSVQPPPETIDKGSIAWLFDDDFCDFSQYQLCFYVSVRYRGGSYAKRIMRTTCPDRFVNNEGRAPPGAVAMVVTGNNAGQGLQHHHVPASFLTPAPPSAKNQFVLVLRGDLQGQFCRVVRWAKKEQKVVVSTASDGSSSREQPVVPAEDVCLAVPSQ